MLDSTVHAPKTAAICVVSNPYSNNTDKVFLNFHQYALDHQQITLLFGLIFFVLRDFLHYDHYIKRFISHGPLHLIALVTTIKTTATTDAIALNVPTIMLHVKRKRNQQSSHRQNQSRTYSRISNKNQLMRQKPNRRCRWRIHRT